MGFELCHFHVSLQASSSVRSAFHPSSRSALEASEDRKKRDGELGDKKKERGVFFCEGQRFFSFLGDWSFFPFPCTD